MLLGWIYWNTSPPQSIAKQQTNKANRYITIEVAISCYPATCFYRYFAPFPSSPLLHIHHCAIASIRKKKKKSIRKTTLKLSSFIVRNVVCQSSVYESCSCCFDVATNYKSALCYAVLLLARVTSTYWLCRTDVPLADAGIEMVEVQVPACLWW